MDASGTWYSCVLTEYNPDSCLNNLRCEDILKTMKGISLVGALFNVLPFLIHCFEPRLRKNIFCGFLLLTVPDFLLLFMKYLSIQIRSQLKESAENTQFVFNIVMISANVCSFLHIILLSFQELVITTCPSKCNKWITKKSLILASFLAWSASFGVGTLFMLKMKNESSVGKKTFLKVYSITIFTLPILLLGILQILTAILAKLTNATTINAEDDEQDTNSNQTVSRIICMLILVYIITTTPLHIKEILQYFICFITDPWFFVLHHVGTSLALVNHALHPLIYIMNVLRFRSIYQEVLKIKEKWLGRSFETNTTREQETSINLTTYRRNPC